MLPITHTNILMRCVDERSTNYLRCAMLRVALMQKKSQKGVIKDGRPKMGFNDVIVKREYGGFITA